MAEKKGKLTFIPCELHKSHQVGWYCSEHDAVFCRFCKPIRHNDCSIQDLNVLCDDKFLKQDKRATLASLTTLKGIAQTTLDARKISHTTTLKEIEDNRNGLRRLRKDMTELFNSYETSLAAYEKTSLEILTAEAETCSCIIEQVSEKHQLLELREEETSGASVFEANMKAKQMSKDYESVVEKIRDASKQKFCVVYDDRVSKMIKTFSDLFNSEGRSSEDIAENNTRLDSDYNSFWNIKSCTLTKEIDVKFKSDTYISDITGCCFAKNSHLILCDNKNSKLKFLDEGIRHKYELPCTFKPFDVVLVNEKKVLVSNPVGKQLHYVTILPGIKMGSCLRVGDSCYGLDVNNDKIYACVANVEHKIIDYMTYKKVAYYGFHGIRIYTFAGNVLTSIEPVGQGRPQYLALNTKGTNIVYSGKSDTDAFVTCVTETEHGIYKYSGKMLANPRALVLDDMDNLLVCDGSSNVVMALNSDGVRSKCMLTETDKLDTPISMCYNKKTNVLTVASADTAGGVCQLKVFNVLFK